MNGVKHINVLSCDRHQDHFQSFFILNWNSPPAFSSPLYLCLSNELELSWCVRETESCNVVLCVGFFLLARWFLAHLYGVCQCLLIVDEAPVSTKVDSWPPSSLTGMSGVGFSGCVIYLVVWRSVTQAFIYGSTDPVRLEGPHSSTTFCLSCLRVCISYYFKEPNLGSLILWIFIFVSITLILAYIIIISLMLLVWC